MDYKDTSKEFTKKLKQTIEYTCKRYGTIINYKNTEEEFIAELREPTHNGRSSQIMYIVVSYGEDDKIVIYIQDLYITYYDSSLYCMNQAISEMGLNIYNRGLSEGRYNDDEYGVYVDPKNLDEGLNQFSTLLDYILLTNTMP